MSRPLASALLLAALSLAGCDDVPPPPGEVIGTFQFKAELQDPGDGGCVLPESPAELRFDAVLSYEPTFEPDGRTRKFWLQLLGEGGRLREGRLEGTRFTVRSPVDPGRVPRNLDACRLDEDGDGLPDRTRCTLGFAEFIEGDLLKKVPPVVGCTASGIAACTECRLAADDGPEKAGGVCGDVTEDVLPATSGPACYCTGTDGAVTPAAPCVVVYRLVGRLS